MESSDTKAIVKYTFYDMFPVQLELYVKYHNTPLDVLFCPVSHFPHKVLVLHHFCMCTWSKSNILEKQTLICFGEIHVPGKQFTQ